MGQQRCHTPTYTNECAPDHVQFQQSTGELPDDGPMGLKHVGADVLVFKSFNI
jgi:hypothetical protein